MKNPKLIETIIEGALYKVPTFKVTNEGIDDGSGIEIVFCKGNKEDETVLRQEGMFTETLIQTAKQFQGRKRQNRELFSYPHSTSLQSHVKAIRYSYVCCAKSGQSNEDVWKNHGGGSYFF